MKMEKQSIKNRIEEKIQQIEKFLEELSEMKPSSFEEYEKNIKSKAICERYCEKIPEAIVDLVLLFIKYKNLPMPEDEDNAFRILKDNKIISENLSKSLQDAKGMRNIIAHEYGRIDDKIIFEAASHELEKDAKEFIKAVLEKIK